MFDARAAKSLGDGDHLTFTECPGLRLVAQGEQRTFIYRYRSPVSGALRQVKLGRWPVMSFAAAVAAWQRRKTERDAGGDPAEAKRVERKARDIDTGYTVRRACDDYLGRYRDTVAPKTFAEAARLLEIELVDLADMQAAQVTRTVAFELISSKRDKPVVAANLRRLLGAVWEDAHDAGRLSDDVPNWWRQILRGKLKSKGKVIGGEHQGATKRALSEDELRIVLRFLPNFSRDVRDVCELYLWTACRGAEICAMERNEVTDEDDGLLWWTVPREKLKMRRNPLTCDLRVPLFGRAQEIVRRRLEVPKGRWLFPSPGKTGHVEQKATGVAVWSHMPYAETRPDWVRPRLAVTHWAPHDLRRTSRTLLSKLGCPSDVAEAILGHLPPGVQGVYNRHQYDAERKTWLERLATRLDALASPWSGTVERSLK
jgi:integrase